MGFFDSLQSKLSGKQNPDEKAKRFLLGKLTLTEIKKINKEYTGIKGIVDYYDDNGIKRTREATRFEMEDLIVRSVPLEVLTQIHPKLKKFLDDDS